MLNLSDEQLVNTLALALFPTCAILALLVIWAFSWIKKDD